MAPNYTIIHFSVISQRRPIVCLDLGSVKQSNFDFRHLDLEKASRVMRVVETPFIKVSTVCLKNRTAAINII